MVEQSQIDDLKFKFGELEQYLRDQLLKVKAGKPGPQGEKGPKGDPGFDLRAATEAANNFVEERLIDFQSGLTDLILHLLKNSGVLDVDGRAVLGPRGERGQIGPEGRGETGLKGDRGETGLKGEKGEKGDQGLEGLRGPQGKPGDISAAIASAERETMRILRKHGLISQ